MRSTKEIGDFYEREVIRYLQQKGYRILSSNYRCRFGEIDWIAMAPDGITLVYGETKYRKTTACGHGLEAVDSRKIRKICKTAMYHYSSQGMEGERPVRFDVIAIDSDKNITHIENAFDYME